MWVNDELRQHAKTRDLILNLSEMISVALSASTLYPSDLTASGKPAGVEQVLPDDVFTINAAHVAPGRPGRPRRQRRVC